MITLDEGRGITIHVTMGDGTPLEWHFPLEEFTAPYHRAYDIARLHDRLLALLGIRLAEELGLRE